MWWCSDLFFYRPMLFFRKQLGWIACFYVGSVLCTPLELNSVQFESSDMWSTRVSDATSPAWKLAEQADASAGAKEEAAFYRGLRPSAVLAITLSTTSLHNSVKIHARCSMEGLDFILVPKSLKYLKFDILIHWYMKKHISRLAWYVHSGSSVDSPVRYLMSYELALRSWGQPEHSMWRDHPLSRFRIRLLRLLRRFRNECSSSAFAGPSKCCHWTVYVNLFRTIL